MRVGGWATRADSRLRFDEEGFREAALWPREEGPSSGTLLPLVASEDPLPPSHSPEDIASTLLPVCVCGGG